MCYTYNNERGLLSESKEIKVEFIEGKEVLLTLKLQPWQQISLVKQKIEKQCSFQNKFCLFFKNIELDNNKNLDTYGILDYTEQSDRRIYIKFKEYGNPSNRKVTFEPCFEDLPKSLLNKIHEVKRAFQIGLAPQLTMGGTSGTYILRNPRKINCGVFKPRDEEAFAPYNPRGHIGKLGSHGFRNNVRSGEAAEREVAAFLLDKGYAGVPETTLVESYHPAFKFSSDFKSKYFTDKETELMQETV